MGRIHDALKKAQEERERRRAKQEATPTTPRRLTDRTTDAPTVEPSRRSPIKDDLDTFASSRSETARQPVLPPQQPKKKPNLAGAMRRVPTMGESPLPALGNIGATLLSYHSPADYRSEQFRTLRTNISVLDPSPEILGVTSALRGEGVNMTAANLGVCFAEAATERVLIVDADLRDPRLATFFGFRREMAGLADVLAERVKPEKAPIETAVPNLFIVPSGSAVANPGSLITGLKIARALSVWRGAFDRVIVVTPPVSVANDASVLGHEVDGMLMVVKLGTTPRRVTERAIETMATSGVKLLGCVLTNSERLSGIDAL